MQTDIIWFLVAINDLAWSCVYAALTRMSSLETRSVMIRSIMRRQVYEHLINNN